MHLFWHRRDLRVADNVGLAAAADSGAAVVPAFVFDPAVLSHAGPPRVRFMLDALGELRSRYRARGSDLVVAEGAPRDVLPSLCAEFDADRVVWNRDYSGLARQRDDAVERTLGEDGVETSSYHDALLHEPGSITTADGEPYSVFTYFGKKWHDREKADPVEPPPSSSLADVSGDPLPALDSLGVDEPSAHVPAAGPDAARERLDAFCDRPIFEYADRRDYPASEATSRLSPHLKFGTIGVREVYQATEHARGEASDDAGRESVHEFQTQLAWREFYAHVLRYNPSVVSENYKSYERPIEWREDPDALQAWKDGETGYPIVDAGMRQLRREAWMHNRVRMIVASFLTKDLLVDWRAGYDWFRERLVDHDAANDSGGWQWAASTGTDAQPFFRIFNPMTQGERFDPDAVYVHEYVPELADVSAETIHRWHELDPARRDDVAPAYPAPIVDHQTRREEALAMFRRARGEDNA